MESEVQEDLPRGTKKQPVADADDFGRYQDSWLWQCDSCGEKIIYKKGEIPPGWEVEDDDDLLNTWSECKDCLEDME